MNQYDPMKDHTTSNDSRNQSYASDDGQGYTNPDGSHGYIYHPDYASKERKTRRYRGAVIALSVVLVTVVLCMCCLVGVYMASRYLGPDHPPVDGTEEDTAPNTSGGLFIDDEKDTDDSGEPSETLPDNGDETKPPIINNQDPTETAPPVASITKLPSQRVDANGDGIADVEFDEDGQVLTSAGKNTMTVATVVNRVAASVVEISTETVTQSHRPGQQVTTGAGSGVIVSKEGFIITNHHVIEGASSITVRLNSGKEFSARLIGSDERSDIAVLWIDAKGTELTVATLGASFDLVAGEDILAIGNPLGSLGGTVTEGMISATARQISVNGVVMTLLQVSAPINPGNSGGGLFNMAGELIGVVNAKVSSEEIEGLGFAIPIDTAYGIILEIIEYGYIKGRPALGFTVVDVTSVQTAMRYFNSFYTGVYVYNEGHDVMKYGDLILSADGVEITSSEDLLEMVAGKSVGDTMELVIYRDRTKQTVTITVAEQKPDTAAASANE